jgi:hypothetical protein
MMNADAKRFCEKIRTRKSIFRTIESNLKLFAVSQANVESGSVADEFVRIQVGHEAGESQAWDSHKGYKRQLPNSGTDISHLKSVPGLPDCIFSYQKIPITDYLKGLAVENFGKCISPNRYILNLFGIPMLRPFVILCGRFVYFSQFWYIAWRDIWQPRSVRN